METHTFEPADPISIMALLKKFKLACDPNCNHKLVASSAMQSFVADSVVSSLYIHVVQSDGARELATAVSLNGFVLQALRSRKHSEVINHLLKRCAKNEAIAKVDAAVVRFCQLTGIILLQYDKAFRGRAIHVTDVYDEGTQNDWFIEGENESIRWSLCRYVSMQLHADRITLFF